MGTSAPVFGLLVQGSLMTLYNPLLAPGPGLILTLDCSGLGTPCPPPMLPCWPYLALGKAGSSSGTTLGSFSSTPLITPSGSLPWLLLHNQKGCSSVPHPNGAMPHPDSPVLSGWPFPVTVSAAQFHFTTLPFSPPLPPFFFLFLHP